VENQRGDAIGVSSSERQGDEAGVACGEDRRSRRPGLIENREQVVDERLDGRDIRRRKAL
jgi:hypothetical protein